MTRTAACPARFRGTVGQAAARRRPALSLALALAATALSWPAAHAAAPAADAPPAFREATFEQGRLRYVNHLPVLTVAGTPEEIGRQKAALLAEAVRQLADYPKRLVTALGREDRWEKLVTMGRRLGPQIPPDHAAEMRAFAVAFGGDRELGLVANTLMDTYRGSFACSSLLIEPARSATGGPLFARNLDFFTLDLLQKYSLVLVHRPQGKRAFAAVGFPGLFGCLSGMNDAGLAVAVHEVYLAQDNAPIFNPQGVPYTFAFRRVLEECATVAEAEKLLGKLPRTTMLNLAVCDARQAAVFEMTAKTLAVRRAEDGLAVCTNHFRSPELVILPWCRRYGELLKAREQPKLDVAAMAKKLDEVHQGRMTVQSMIFEPAALRLHLAIGPCPASSQPFRALELRGLYKD